MNTKKTSKVKINEADSLIQELRQQKAPKKSESPKKSVKLQDEVITPVVVNPPVITPVPESVSIKKEFTKFKKDYANTPEFNDPLVILSKRVKHFQSISDRTLYAIYLQGGGEFIEHKKAPMTLKVSRGNQMKFGHLFGTLKIGNVLYYMIRHNHFESEDFEMLIEPLEILQNYNYELKNFNK